MDILFLLVPLSVALALAVMGVLAWAIATGQFEDMDVEGRRILGEEGAAQKTTEPPGAPSNVHADDAARH